MVPASETATSWCLRNQLRRSIDGPRGAGNAAHDVVFSRDPSLAIDVSAVEMRISSPWYGEAVRASPVYA